jgi:hypothetical protein
MDTKQLQQDLDRVEDLLLILAGEVAIARMRARPIPPELGDSLQNHLGETLEVVLNVKKTLGLTSHLADIDEAMEPIQENNNA